MKKTQVVLLAAFALAFALLGKTATAQSEYITQSPVIHVTHGTTDSVYWTNSTVWHSVPSGCTGSVTGTLYIQYIDPISGTVMTQSLVHGYSNPSNGSSLAVGTSTWNTTSGTYTVDYYNGYIASYQSTHNNNLPPSGQYTYKYKLVPNNTIDDPNYGPINSDPVFIYQSETFTIVR